ncbi:hypothetical protein K469DRAFT_722497 [Zopfia rhizophila CBS 207.26]|uniref:PIG-L family deacetylase n=1 Tax=Zopfia rhizophila CBS 207.26 TaxID=1314779 RepID=A0A6A6EWR3_9PEZI|nr:hypothetical protein K469DRAFT_722497 [Zopfia rhizophila CBS 207.26]
MNLFPLICRFLLLLVVAIAFTTPVTKSAKPGAIYFVAHPVDGLLYQNPDLFHDFHIFKCTTMVFFTSGDRGIIGNYSESCEKGLENAYSYLTGVRPSDDAWGELHVEFEEKPIVLRTLKEAPHVQILYLRLPNGSPDGNGYETNDGESLRKVYEGEIKLVTTIDGSATYTLESLINVVSTILKTREARDVRVLGYKTPFPTYNDRSFDHADHSASARIVVDVMKRDEIKRNIPGHVSSLMHEWQPTLNLSGNDFQVKEDSFHYAEFDEHTCHDYMERHLEAENFTDLFRNDDVKYVLNWLEREYYVE